MKLERLNENQIRITLTGEDLQSRNIRVSELAYGSEKARSLFRDMMRQAYTKLGFNADNIPLMIEAIPVSPDSITLLITKVEDPEELDMRFARFSPSKDQTGKPEKNVEDADDIIQLIRKLYDAKQKAAEPAKGDAAEERKAPQTAPRSAKAAAKPVHKAADPTLDFVRLYRFRDLESAIGAAQALKGSYSGINTLYKTDSQDPYCLILHKSAHTPEEFNRVCNIISEYGSSEACTAAREAHLLEHDRPVIMAHALQTLASL